MNFIRFGAEIASECVFDNVVCSADLGGVCVEEWLVDWSE